MQFELHNKIFFSIKMLLQGLMLCWVAKLCPRIKKKKKIAYLYIYFKPCWTEKQRATGLKIIFTRIYRFWKWWFTWIESDMLTHSFRILFFHSWLEGQVGSDSWIGIQQKGSPHCPAVLKILLVCFTVYLVCTLEGGDSSPLLTRGMGCRGGGLSIGLQEGGERQV